MFVEVIIVAIIGVLAGGLVNALADDLPDYLYPERPHYPDGTPRPYIAWLGITAFLSGSRSAASSSRLSWRHPATELVTAALMVITLLRTQNDPDVPTGQLIFWLIYMAIFVLITVIDIEHRLILFTIMIPSYVIALLDAVVTPERHGPDVMAALLGAGLGFGVFFLMYIGGIFYARYRNISDVAFGYGDVMLIVLSGLIIGWRALLFAIFLTVISGAIGSILYLAGSAIRGRDGALFKALPYGPYIILGTWLMMLYSAEVRYAIFGY